VEAALRITGQDYRVVDAASWEPGPGLDELRRHNPPAQIPTLVLPDGTVMTESAAILIHLGLQFPHSALLPTEPSARALAMRGLVYIVANCYSTIGVIDFPERWCVDATTGEQERIRQAARARLHHLWDSFADQFAAGDQVFMGGEQPGALDILAAVVSKWSGSRAHLAGSRPAFAALLARVEQHPRFADIHAQHWPSIGQ
jgi:GST-like protein